jgi:hypothetical protein
MSIFQRRSSPKRQLLMFLGTVVGGAVTLLMLKTLSYVFGAVVTAIAITLLLFALTELSNPRLWWLCAGAMAGIIVGMSFVLEKALIISDAPLELNSRLGIIAILGLGGLLSGVVLGISQHKADVPTLDQLISRLTGLTISVFAVVVTLRFIIDGLEEARTLSSRLTTTTTIVATALILPGLLGYFIAERRTSS